MSMPSGMELLVIVIVILLLFGGKKIPELAKGLAGGIKSFKQELNDDDKSTVAKSEKIETKETHQDSHNQQTKQS